MNINLPYSQAQESEKGFMQQFANLYEHSPWVAEEALKKVKSNAEYNDLEKFHSLLSEILINANAYLQQSLILAHPMLTGKKKSAKDLTKFSTIEQKSAGLDNCTDKEIDMFRNLNEEYLKKYKFPFIMAIKEKSKAEIVSGFEKRKDNSIEQEKANAINEINKIAWLRIKDIYGI
jgi:OHCU decarboxylase